MRTITLARAVISRRPFIHLENSSVCLIVNMRIVYPYGYTCVNVIAKAYDALPILRLKLKASTSRPVIQSPGVAVIYPSGQHANRQKWMDRKTLSPPRFTRMGSMQ